MIGKIIPRDNFYGKAYYTGNQVHEEIYSSEIPVLCCTARKIDQNDYSFLHELDNYEQPHGFNMIEQWEYRWDDIIIPIYFEDK